MKFLLAGLSVVGLVTSQPLLGADGHGLAPCPFGQVRCTSLLQARGLNCAMNACVTPAKPSIVPVTSGKDEHGCYGGAGYRWCEAKQKCHRLWEEDCEEPQIADETDMMAPIGRGDHDSRPHLIGGGDHDTTRGGVSLGRMGAIKDEKGCLTSAGYQWCEAKGKCHRAWEEDCEERQLIGGGDHDEAEETIDERIRDVETELRHEAENLVDAFNKALNDIADAAW